MEMAARSETITVTKIQGALSADALEAVKLDPAVLEAQVTVHSNDRTVNAANTKPEAVSKTNKVVKPPKPEPTPSQCSKEKSFENMVKQQEAALLSLTPQQLELLMKYADVLRRQRMITQKYLVCSNNCPNFTLK
ncbi:hypothetical protein HF086_007870 [Spodoptera exigua]|uniref:Uncharacterized protein n=1 Tax=Spodoptera exigua TaxID=7107 RepID=A0A922MYI9_SPOEX|nr:hypothetical protein HF086_007870 [Spodoptera exigua]